jgi:hypothetical protein
VHRKIRQRAEEGMSQTAVEGSDKARLRVPQPDIADSFRKAKAALEDATKDIAELRRRAGQLGRRSG